MIELNKEQLHETLKSGERILLDFFTQTCSVCKSLSPQLEIAEEETGIPVIKVDAEENTELAERFMIMKVPQIILIENNEEKNRKIGFVPSEAIIEMIENKLQEEN